MSNNTDQSKLLALFEPFDEEWQSTTRSIRIDGTVTSVRLENFYWRVVAEIAKGLGLQVPQLMTLLSKTAKTGDTKHTNFTSFVRVCCGRYLDGRETHSGSDGVACAASTGQMRDTGEPESMPGNAVMNGGASGANLARDASRLPES